MSKPPRTTRATLRTTPRIAQRDDGRLWLHLGSGPLVEHVAQQFAHFYPAAEVYVDDILEEVWVWEPQMAVEEYAHLGVKVSVEWFRRS